MRSKRKYLNNLLSIAVVCLLISIQAAVAEAKSPAIIIPYDAITAPGLEVWPQAKLLTKRFQIIESPLGGERLEFYEGTRYLGLALTGGDGIGAIRYAPLSVGIHRIKIRLTADSEYTAPEQELLISVWDTSRKLLIISIDSLRVRARDFIFPFIGMSNRGAHRNPMAESINALKDMSVRYNLVYLYHGESSYLPEIKSWLAKHGFPVSPVVMWDDGKRFIKRLVKDQKRDIEAVVVTSEDEANLFQEEQIRTILLADKKNRSERSFRGQDAVIVSDWEEIKQNIN